MSVDEVRARVAAIAVYAEELDDENAHVAEDELCRAVLDAIAAGRCEDPSAVAREALRSFDVGFSRWCS